MTKRRKTAPHRAGARVVQLSRIAQERFVIAEMDRLRKSDPERYRALASLLAHLVRVTRKS